MTFVALATSTMPVVAGEPAEQEPFVLRLFDPNSFAGWDYGESTAGWHMRDGQLLGSETALPLVSGWTLGQFELRFNWAVSEGGVLRFVFPRVPDGPAIELTLSETDHGAVLVDGQQTLAQGGAIARRFDGLHTAVIRREGAEFSVLIDDAPVLNTQLMATERLGLSLAVGRGNATIAGLVLDEPPGPPIFNGVDLTGWWTPGNLASWRIENGELVCLNKKGDYLRTEHQYANMTLSLEYKMRRGGNSGIGIRTPRNAWPSGDGIELQIMDEPLLTPMHRGSTMSLYGNLEPFARPELPEQWNRLVVRTEGYLVSAWINGVLVQHANTRRLPELRHRHTTGWIGIQDHGSWIRVRHVSLLEMPEGLGLSTWYAPRAEQLSQQVLDRLMNPVRLSEVDQLRTHFVQAAVTSVAPTVLADVEGPGALVGMSRTVEGGRLTLYFDDETSPRIDCPADELAQHLPHVADAAWPLVTFVGFQKRLRIMLSEASEATYRLAFVNGTSQDPTADEFPAVVADQGGIARGMLPAMSYRLGQFEGGRHREDDPYPRPTGSEQTLEPGARATLASAEGAGIVQWWKLIADTGVLSNNDLWLEVNVDGETEPALSAPARFLFPGLSQGNFRNFVVLNRGGFTSLLAMPFSQGISISAVNHGTSSMGPMSAVLSVSPDDDSQSAKDRMRLRGLFVDAADDTSKATFSLLSIDGHGRWIGWIAEDAAIANAQLESIEIDGSKPAAWSSVPFDALLGAPRAEGEFRKNLSGRAGGLAWRFMLLDPVEFDRSLRVHFNKPAGPCLALYYLKK